MRARFLTGAGFGARVRFGAGFGLGVCATLAYAPAARADGPVVPDQPTAPVYSLGTGAPVVSTMQVMCVPPAYGGPPCTAPPVVNPPVVTPPVVTPPVVTPPVVTPPQPPSAGGTMPVGVPGPAGAAGAGLLLLVGARGRAARGRG